jgi:hypothetical protein
MLSRALSLATVTLLIGCFAAGAALAQATNLEAGKSPSQIFAGTCTACHKGPRGLLKTVPAGSLQGFLKQHYTTSPEMASLLAAFLVSNGATDSRYVGSPAKPGKDEKSDLKPGGPPEQLDRFGHRLRPTPAQEAARPEAEPKEAAKPDADGLEPGRHGRGRTARRLARPGEAPAAEGQTPDQAAGERGPDGRKLSAKQKLSKRSKPGSEEPPKSDSAKSEPGKTEPGKDESAKGETAKEETPKNETAKPETGKTETGNSDTAKVESGKPDGSKPEGAKPPAEVKSESAKIETPKETGSSETSATRADPVSPVTPAPAASPGVSAAVSSGKAEPSSGSSVQPAPPAVAASAPPPPPVAPAGPPAPPISQ